MGLFLQMYVHSIRLLQGIPHSSNIIMPWPTKTPQYEPLCVTEPSIQAIPE